MNWEPFKGYAFPPFNLIPAVLNKVAQGKADIILVAPLWQAQPWWPLLLSLLVEQPVLIPTTRHLLKDPSDPRRTHPTFPRLHPAVTHISGDSTKQWESLKTLPRYSFQHLVRPSTRKTYRSAWGRWNCWCDIPLYLTEFFNDGAAYCSVNVARSDISTAHTKVDGHPTGQHPLVTQQLKGMFNSRPPKPRYSHTWDITLVTKHLASLGSNRLLFLKQLSLTPSMLFL